jgi:hypothetical protein
MDCLSGYFIIKIEVGLLDIELSKLTPTWRNKGTWEDRISKRVEQFLIYEGF